MEEMNNILDYFINYEIENRLENIELDKKTFINIKKDDYKNTTYIQNKILKKKIKCIENVINRIKWKNTNKVNEIIKCLKEIERAHLSLKEHFHFQEIITKENYKYPDNYYKDLKYIETIINDNHLFILYPILANGNRKIPLICFEMKLGDNHLKIDSYHVQIDALRIVLSFILKCELSEVELLVNDYNGFYQSISSLEQESIFNMIEIIEKEIENKFSIQNFSFWNNKDYENWAMTKEIILTMESFKEVLFPPYQEEIEEVKYYLQKDSSQLLNKYLSINKKSVFSDKIILNGHFGSYTEEYGINYKQMNILSAYQKAELLAVNGPPGTGKTTVIKEIIADNIVKKTKLLIDNWENCWTTIGKGKQQVKKSPLDGMCQYSMMIASGNNKAVDNIGMELLQEVPYFSDVVKNVGGIKGLLCARLGKYDNLNDFHEYMLNPLINYLTHISNYYEIEVDSYKYEFMKKYNEINDLNNKISKYISLRISICNELMDTGLFDKEINESSVRSVNILQNRLAESLEIEIEDCKSELEQLNKEKSNKSDTLLRYSQIAVNYNDRIAENNSLIDKLTLASQSFLFSKSKVKKLEKKFGTKSNLIRNIEELQNAMQLTQVACNEIKVEIETIKNQISLISKDLKIKSDDLKHVEKNIKKLQGFDSLMKEYQNLVDTFNVEAKWNSEKYTFLSHKNLVIKRHKLFELSLKITECYIKKYAKDIIFNLNKVYPDKWFQPFFRSDFRYNEDYVCYLKAIWETLFLCFPVTTTTLYALDRKKFPMIKEIFDTLLIDEAGQSAIHTAIGPLFRFRKAVVVGDVFQLEPIRRHKNEIIETSHLSAQLKSLVNADENSIQNAADRGSDVYDILKDEKVGIILNEHRRCEKSIVQFSNQYVYNNCLQVTKENQIKPFLNRNIVMLDVRGIKSDNINSTEIDICIRVVDKLVEIYGDEYKKKIGIITPYRKQADSLNDHFKNIDCGTVHVFQGDEKEIIILSLVIDNPKQIGSLNFIGGKPNFLNVAFTRAKSQLIIIGNYETCSLANNYLSKAMEIVRTYGKIYSLYESDIICDESITESYREQFLHLLTGESSSTSEIINTLELYSSKGIITGPKKHNELLFEIIPKIEKSISIISPWIRSNVVTSEFLENISQLKNDNREITICFGYNKTDYNLDDIERIVKKDNFGGGLEKDIDVIRKIHELLEEKLKYIPPIHSKVLIVDDILMIIGSHNWLSNKGGYPSSKDEVSCIIYDQDAIKYIKRRYNIEVEDEK